MKKLLTKLYKILQAKLGFAPRPPLDTLDALVSFCDKQSAYVSQVTLYGYVKTRAGTQWPKLFNNETYLISLKIARWHIFGACVADLTLFIIARIYASGGITAAQAEKAAILITDRILSQIDQNDVQNEVFVEMAHRASQRAKMADWSVLAEGPNAFQSSSDALMKWAPTADEFKVLDEEIVRNSIHLRWINIRRDVLETLVMDTITAEIAKL